MKKYHFIIADMWNENAEFSLTRFESKHKKRGRSSPRLIPSTRPRGWKFPAFSVLNSGMSHWLTVGTFRVEINNL